jgi:hypothetical protein
MSEAKAKIQLRDYVRSDDIDFAIINNEDESQMDKIVPLLEKYLLYFT